ncbi:MAG TPA: thioesterase domain-containing protein, partial [Candidatus Eisenbacteria bacterium]|nr:thioesterase domain-containing protein [Candidatus Eisenbacteria bacterium]
PAVAQAVAFAVPHETLGEDIAAAVVLASGRAAGEEEIRQFVAARVADFKVPSQILIVDELPKGPSGKIQRIGLAETLRSRLDGSFAPPRTAVELALATIWADVLGIRRPGIRDNFFALGGDSLSAARVFSRIAQKYGKTLPLATLFEAPTIEKLAAVLENGIPHGPAPCVVAIQPQGSRPPFFCIHNPGGEVLLYRNLARHLGADQPFYGIQAQGIDGKAPVHTTVEEMAGHYIREIQKIQARGPYFLGGFCFGGQIAFEIARRLSERGEKIGLVAMFESFVRRYPPALQAELPPVKLFPWLQQKIAVHVRALLKMRPERRMQYFTRRLRNLKIMVHLWLLRVIGDLCKACGVSLPSVLQLRDLTLIHYQAGRTYVPQPFAGNVVLFLSQETLETSIEDPSAPWRRLTSGKLQVRHLACTHYDILREPAVEDLAQELRDCIDRELALILVTAPQRAKPAVSEHTHS